MEGGRHSISLDNREKLAANGITDILSFDEEAIVAQTEKGILIIRGYDLHIDSLDLEKGSLVADGNISGLTYDNDEKNKSGIFARLFR